MVYDGVNEMSDKDQDIITELLERKVRTNKKYKNEPWIHPGKVQCHIPYNGSYGSFINKSRKDNSFGGSLQCGISGSVNFPFFMYLISVN